MTAAPQPRPYFLVSKSTDARISAAFGSRSTARLPRPAGQRNEQRLLDRAKLNLHAVCPTGHHAPRSCLRVTTWLAGGGPGIRTAFHCVRFTLPWFGGA